MMRGRAAGVVQAIANHRRWLAIVAITGSAAVLSIWMLLESTRPIVSERSGVDQLRIHRSAQGHMLDLRYRVVDPERATSLLARSGEAYLIHRRSGRRLTVPSTPKAGPLRTTGQPELGRSYFALFSNPGGLVRRGDQVSVVVGDLTTELTVE